MQAEDWLLTWLVKANGVSKRVCISTSDLQLLAAQASRKLARHNAPSTPARNLIQHVAGNSKYKNKITTHKETRRFFHVPHMKSYILITFHAERCSQRIAV